MTNKQHDCVVTIRVYYDFASTLCYVAHKVLTGIEAQIGELGIELQWRPLDLTKIVPWNRGDSFSPEVRTSVRNTAMTLGLDVEMPDPWLDSRPAANVALETSSIEAEARWRRGVFDAIYEQRRFALTPELQELAKELTGTDSLNVGGESFELVEESTRDAIVLGVTGVPTFLLDDSLFGGVFDADSMLEVLRQLAEQHRESGGSAVN